MRTRTRKRALLIGSTLVLASLIGLAVAFAGGTQNPVEHHPEFDATAAEEEGYWYSRYNLGNLVMRSGLGETFMPEMAMVQQMIEMVDLNPADGDTAMPPLNAVLLKSVYASGDPHYIKSFDADDFATQRWDPTAFDTAVTSRAMGWTMIKETEWAKQFHVDEHFGTPVDDFGAQWRFVGMVLAAEAKMQAQYALNGLKNAAGLIANSDGTVDWGGQWVMLEALSDLGGLLGTPTLPHSATNRYFDRDGSAMFLAAADMLFVTIVNRESADIEELSLAVQSLTWYAANTKSAANQAQAISLIRTFGEILRNAEADNTTDKAYAIRGLVEAYRVSGEARYLAATVGLFREIAAEFDEAYGVFTSQSRYTIDNVAVILGALNSLKLFVGNTVDQVEVEEIFTRFFESSVNLSGLQIAAPPKDVAKGLFEQDEPDIFYAYPGMALPPIAGGKFGVAPVFATEVLWNGSRWSVTNARFDTAGAMHASNEMIWFHNDEVNGFPEVTIYPGSCG